MSIIVIIYIVLVLFGIKPRKNNDEYLKKESTCNIKGIFAIMILLSHFRGYVSVDSSSFYVKFIIFFDQLMVAIFLFYSGYGIMESMKNKKGYMKSFLKNRFLKTLIHLNIAVIIYAIIMFLLGNKYSLTTYLLSLIGWESIGNSNWFIFVILALYLITYLSNLIISNKKIAGIILTTILSCALIIVLRKLKEPWWYNTVLCYPCGLLYSYYKDKIDKFILSKYKYISLAIIFALFLLVHEYTNNFIIYEVLACIFCLLIINITYVFSISNRILYFIGTYSFEIYMLQRISYTIFEKIISNPVLYFIVSAICTILISVIFKYLTNYIDKLLFTKKVEA